ncbi:hypothetical protein ACVNF4_30705, partial [Streptomyces sp. S6]
MTVDQLPGQVREFVSCLEGLLGRLDQGGGWCAVFWQRDPDGMRACLDGSEMPPWDVLEALLQDLASAYGAAVAEEEARRVRVLHIAALRAHDARPGARDVLGDRLDVMLREQRYAVERQAEAGRQLASAITREQAEAVRLDLAWAHDDHARATARCAELRSRIAELDRAEREVGDSPGGGGGAAGPGRTAEFGRDLSGRLRGFRGGEGEFGGAGTGAGAAGAAGGAAGGAMRRGRETEDGVGGLPVGDTRGDTVRGGAVSGDAGGAVGGGEPAAVVPKQRKRRRGSARFAGIEDEEPAVAVPEETVVAVPEGDGGTGPRGARPRP